MNKQQKGVRTIKLFGNNRKSKYKLYNAKYQLFVEIFQDKNIYWENYTLETIDFISMLWQSYRFQLLKNSVSV